jgi:hypothetical protein
LAHKSDEQITRREFLQAQLLLVDSLTGPSRTRSRNCSLSAKPLHTVANGEFL